MKDIPILFSGSMVRAIMEDRKTQTRRVIVPQPKVHQCQNVSKILLLNWNGINCGSVNGIGPDYIAKHSRYGHAGDRLWVRETFCPQLNMFGQEFPDRTPFYRADGDKLPILHKWKPSIFMPRWACRLNLEVVNIKVERLQDISADDARAEGITPHCDGGCKPQCNACDEIDIDTYRRLWDSINGKTHPWKSNPWLWAITFKRIAF